MTAATVSDPGNWLERRHYPDLPAEAERALRQAGLSWADEVEAERWLQRAAQLAPSHLAVHIGRYRNAFYRHQYADAVLHAHACLAHVARARNFAGDWRQVRAGDADFASEDADLRLWLRALQALGYVLMRAGRLEDGRDAWGKVLELDPADRFGTGRLLALSYADDDQED